MSFSNGDFDPRSLKLRFIAFISSYLSNLLGSENQCINKRDYEIAFGFNPQI